MNIHDPAFWEIKRKRAAERESLRLYHAQRMATLTGERDALRERVAELEARLADAERDKAFYMGLFVDSQKGG